MKLVAWRALASLGAALSLAVVSGAAMARPALVVEVSVKPKDRAALRRAMSTSLQANFRREAASGAIDGFRLFQNRYPDAGAFDEMVVLSFRDDAALARWVAKHREAGLSPATLALAQSVVTTPAEVARSGGDEAGASASPVLVVPYTALVSAPDYLKYLDDYTVPQFKGWMGEGVLGAYAVLTSRYPAGRPWSSLILLRYRDEAALARRDEVVAKVRRALADDPAWKAVSDAKKAIRTEHALAVADLVGSGRP